MQLKLTLEYDGAGFHGWQLQPARPTVQGALEHALATLLRMPVRVRAAGRTDAGVHASGQVAVVPVVEVPDDLERFRRCLNGLLPRTVAVHAIEVVDDAFDPRRHARRRRYLYRLWNAPTRSPLWARMAWHVRTPLDVAAMDAAAAMLVGRRDLESFRGADPHPPVTTVREIFVSRVECEGPLVTYGIEATAFLKHMVRNIVGTLVEVGGGRRPAATMDALLAARDRRRAAPTAPAHGLVLVSVEY